MDAFPHHYPKWRKGQRNQRKLKSIKHSAMWAANKYQRDVASGNLHMLSVGNNVKVFLPSQSHLGKSCLQPWSICLQ